MDLKEMFINDSVEKQLNIVIDGATYTNADLQGENMELTEQLCTESTLRFGSCEASVFQLRIINTVMSLKGKWMNISMELKEETSGIYQLGTYKVNSDKPTADRRYRDIVAYDAMHDIIVADVAGWYNTILPDESSEVTLKEFRDSFLAHFGIEQEEVELPNDSMKVTKTIEPTKLSGKTVITAICEINGCFGHIGRNGKFQYIFLKEMREGLYPSDTLYPWDDLYPADPMNAELISKSYYISANYEDFTTAKINKLQIRQEEDDIGCIYGDGDNCYIVQDNFLVYGKSTEELTTIAANMYSVICKVWYRPAHVEAKGNPCLEVGDGIKLRTSYQIVYTYILQRTLKGIQALRDTYDAEGEQYQSEDVNSTHEDIIQLKGKNNKLTRTLEETKSEIKDMEKGLSTQIKQNASDILLEAQRAIGQEVELAAAIRVNADGILLKVSKDSIISEINQTAETITIKAEKIDLEGLVNAKELVTKFATINTLNATKAELEELIAKKATIDDLNALKATVKEIDADYASVDDLDAVEADLETLIANEIAAQSAWIKKIEADYVDSDYVKSKSAEVAKAEIDSMLNGSMQVYGFLGVLGNFAFKNTSVTWGTVGGVKCLVAAD